MMDNFQNNRVKVTEIFALSIVGSVMLVGCSFNVSTAKLENLKMCGKVTTDRECASDTTKFGKDAAKLFATADLNNAPEGTKVKIDWKYLGGEAGTAADIDSVNLETTANSNTITSHLSAPNKGFPAGKYEVVMSLDTDNSKPIRKQFSIASAK
jgi:hypothetical protein